MVFPGEELTRARDLRPKSELISELFPTLDLPENAICTMGSVGNCRGSPALIRRLTAFKLSAIETAPFNRLESPKSGAGNCVQVPSG